MAVTKGTLAEQYAALFLTKHGYKIVERNYHCRVGEIDLIAELPDEWVFVEVKYRRHQGFGGAHHALSLAQQRRIRQAAAYWLQQYNHSDSYRCRFDLLALSPSTSAGFKVDWLTSAF